MLVRICPAVCGVFLFGGAMKTIRTALIYSISAIGIVLGVIAYTGGMILINAPGWIWSKITGEPFNPIGGPQ